MAAKKTTKKAAGTKATKSAKAPKGAKDAKPAAEKTTAKKAKGKKTSGETKPKRTSAQDAAAQILAGTKVAMSCKELIEMMAAKGLWTSPGGKTPHATLYSAILWEIAAKGKESRFKKTERGRFATNA